MDSGDRADIQLKCQFGMTEVTFAGKSQLSWQQYVDNSRIHRSENMQNVKKYPLPYVTTEGYGT
jgi:hypothetical protein